MHKLLVIALNIIQMSFNNILWTRIYKLVEAKNTGIIKGGD